MNIPIIISEKKHEFIKEALSIDKSVAHRESSAKTTLTFYDVRGLSGLEANLSVKGEEVSEIIKRMYFHHIHLLTDVAIAELYRVVLGVGGYKKIGVKSHPIYEDRNNTIGIFCNINNILNFSSSEIGEFKYYYYENEYLEEFKNIPVRFTVILNGQKQIDWKSCANYKFQYFINCAGADLYNSLIHLIVAFVNNALLHCNMPKNSDINMEIELNLDTKEMTIRNKVYYDEDNNQTIDDLLRIRNEELEAKYKIFPHLTEDKSITLWTLKKLPLYNVGNDWINFKIQNKNNDWYFEAVIKNII